jgi:hypothetical protein
MRIRNYVNADPKHHFQALECGLAGLRPAVSTVLAPEAADVTGLAPEAADVTRLAPEAADVTGLVPEAAGVTGLAPDVTGLAPEAADVTGLAAAEEAAADHMFELSRSISDHPIGKVQ